MNIENVFYQRRCGLQRAKKGLAYALLFALSAAIGTALFSQSTSPLYSGFGYDSAMFQTIGKYWAQGDLPYVELYDHKGPMIFLINAAGYYLAGRTGVFILQVLNAALSEVMAFRILKGAGEKKALCLAVLLPLLLTVNWQEGNTTEEYILPLLFGSMYYMLRWSRKLNSGNWAHEPRWAFVYGLCFGFALMSRVTNGLAVCLGAALISAALAVKGRWIELLKNIVFFLSGAAVLVLPFCLYFARHGALYEMWYGTVLYNLEYFSGSGTAAPQGFLQLLVAVRRYLTGWCLIGGGLWVLLADKENRLLGVFWLLISAVNTAFIYTLNDYAHYGIVLLPFFYLAVLILYTAGNKSGIMKITRILCLLMTAVVLLSSGLKAYKSLTEYIPPQAYEDIVDYGDDYNKLVARIPYEDRSSFVAFNCYRSLYLENDIRPAFRFFVLQQWMIGNSQSLEEKLWDEFRQAEIKWVLSFEPEGANADVRSALEEDYFCCASSEHQVYRLYCLKEEQ